MTPLRRLTITSKELLLHQMCRLSRDAGRVTLREVLLEEQTLQESAAFFLVKWMSCLNYHLITGFGQIAGDDVPSWLLDDRFRLLFPHIKNPPETLWDQAAVCRYLLSQTPGWVKFQVGKKYQPRLSTLSGLKKWGESRQGAAFEGYG